VMTFPKFAPLADRLEAAGWSVSQTELPSDSWWVAEIWSLQSTWSPTNRRLYLSLLIDPGLQTIPDTVGDKHIWAIAISDTFPESHSGEWLLLENTHNISRKIPLIADKLTELRGTSGT
jgi:hypothetical protein